MAKGGKSIWIQASYNLLLDRNGKPFKIVKFASDIAEATKSVDDSTRKVRDASRARCNKAREIDARNVRQKTFRRCLLWPSRRNRPVAWSLLKTAAARLKSRSRSGRDIDDSQYA